MYNPYSAQVCSDWICYANSGLTYPHILCTIMLYFPLWCFITINCMQVAAQRQYRRFNSSLLVEKRRQNFHICSVMLPGNCHMICPNGSTVSGTFLAWVDGFASHD